MNRQLSALSRDYERIAAAIRFIDENSLSQPELQSVADHIGLSSTHFQRLFSRWAGISPKRFLQYVTLAHTRQLLTESNGSTLDTSLAAGLSSVSRLHDLYIQCEAMSPAEYRAGGAGLTIYTGIHPTPFGDCLVALTERGLCGLLFVYRSAELELNALRQRWPGARFDRDHERTGEVCAQIFRPLQRQDQPLFMLVKGTPFQLKVWEALLHIPMGEVTTYQSVAQDIEHASATRAVANAVANNPLHFLIPCHRVIRASGALGGYRAGTTRKRALLAWETIKHRDHANVTPMALGLGLGA